MSCRNGRPHDIATSPMTGDLYCRGCGHHPHMLAVTDALDRMYALAASLAHIGTECDWGQCSEPSVTVRWAEELHQWLPVCFGHRSDANPQGSGS